MTVNNIDNSSNSWECCGWYLNSRNYKIKFGIDNPNEPLISSLVENGVQVNLCGQTAAHRNISISKIHSDIKIALSAMTTLVQLQNEGYRLIKF